MLLITKMRILKRGVKEVEKLPIKLFAKREEDNLRVEDGGNKTLPSFVLPGDDIEEIAEFKPTVVRSSTVEDYKVKLINFQDNALNNAYARRFENYLTEKQIKYKKTKYSPDLYIYKLIKADPVVVDTLVSSEISDLIEEIIPIPKIVFGFNSI